MTGRKLGISLTDTVQMPLYCKAATSSGDGDGGVGDDEPPPQRRPRVALRRWATIWEIGLAFRCLQVLGTSWSSAKTTR